jgi:hypothetical protein
VVARADGAVDRAEDLPDFRQRGLDDGRQAIDSTVIIAEARAGEASGAAGTAGRFLGSFCSLVPLSWTKIQEKFNCASRHSQLRPFEKEYEVAPGVVVTRTGGHTPGHSVVPPGVRRRPADVRRRRRVRGRVRSPRVVQRLRTRPRARGFSARSLILPARPSRSPISWSRRSSTCSRKRRNG